jgi:hypothetical protein
MRRFDRARKLAYAEGMTRAEQKRLRETAKFINGLVEKAMEGLPAEERSRRDAAFFEATARHLEAYEKRLKHS